LLETNLKTAKNKNAVMRVRLRADDYVSYGEAARIMTSIEKAGITKLPLITTESHSMNDGKKYLTRVMSICPASRSLLLFPLQRLE
jgi:hypothetical protein